MYLRITQDASDGPQLLLKCNYIPSGAVSICKRGKIYRRGRYKGAGFVYHLTRLLTV